jgi:hypothetical protein
VILGDFGRFWAILGDFGRFWAIFYTNSLGHPGSLPKFVAASSRRGCSL